MIIGTVRETKTEEYRVAFTPDGAADIVRAGHTVLVEEGAGLGSSYSDDDYRAAGAEVLEGPADVYARASSRCSRRCRRSRAAWPSRSGHTTSSALAPGVACCSAACRACHRPTWS